MKNLAKLNSISISVIAGVLAFVLGLITMFIYPMFKIQNAIGFSLGVSIGIFILNTLVKRAFKYMY